MDIVDKYFKYKIGMAWADAGYGLTIARYLQIELEVNFLTIKISLCL